MVFARYSVFFLVFFCAFSFGPAAFSQKADTPEAAAHQFYSWYMTSFAASETEAPWEDKAIEKYVSKELIMKVQRLVEAEELDYDYFILAQDFFDEWVTHIAAKTIAMKEGEASVLVVLGVKEKNRLLVQMKKQGGAWKITDVAEAD